MRMNNLIIIILVMTASLVAQGKLYEGPDDPASDPAAERYAWHSGNRWLLFFRNTTELGDWTGSLQYDVARWPNNYDGTKMHDGISIIIGARVYVDKNSIPVEDPSGYSNPPDLDTLYYAQSSFREFMDKNPEGTVEWALYPVFGYFNERDEYPGMSNIPNSWPAGGWPSNKGLKWPGEWNGRFGRGIMKADQESFIVVNDAQDQEYLPGNPLYDGPYYFPRRVFSPAGDVLQEIRIGDKKPDVTVQKGMHWGGLGIRVEQRGFQWSNPSAQDAIFFEYTIANISEYTIPEVYFGYSLDNGPGGDEQDVAYYDKLLDMCYSWDYDGVPLGGGVEPGVLGFAFLESPGMAYDGIDNDQDGIIDEERDNQAGNRVGPYDNISNLSDFLNFYNLRESDLREHWDADEDQDWEDGFDANDNGRYAYYDSVSMVWLVEPGERVGDDVGLDGVGPFDLNYDGPDEGECNHRPDYVEGLGCEPNFAATDVNESDMLGLTSFRYLLNWIMGTGGPGTQQDDESLFHRLTRGVFDEVQPEPVNFIEQFASGLFPLYKGRTERVSMSQLAAYDPLAGLKAYPYEAPALFRLKKVVQTIYESDYRFAQPPLLPTLTATPLDGKVVLSWDNISDQFTREAFLGNINDFEGYKLYRATDKKMSDAEQITDGFGTPFLKKPIFQCDLINDKKGFTDFGLINGTPYYLGNDSGIKHHFVDNTVENGRTYYYVLVAYDYGIENIGTGVPPSENTYVIELDEYENIRKISQNVAVVQPHQFAAGYKEADVEKNEAQSDVLGSGWVEPEMLIPSKVKEGHQYKIKFGVERLVHDTRAPMAMLYRNDAIRVYDVTEEDRLVYEETRDDFTGGNFRRINRDIFNEGFTNVIMNYGRELATGEFDGLLIRFFIPVETAQLNETKMGWISGSSRIGIGIAPRLNPGGEQKEVRQLVLPYEYDIVFTGNDSAYVSTYAYPKIWRVSEGDGVQYGANQILYGQNFSFYVANRSIQDETGQDLRMEMVAIDHNRNGEFDILTDEIFVGTTYVTGGFLKGKWGGTAFTINFFDTETEEDLPQPGDVYHIDFIRPFTESDSIVFTVNAEQTLVSDAKLNADMEEIRVVPNPYVMTNTFETNVANYQLSQRRRLMFTHIPAQSTISIFTVSGVLVDVIEVDNAEVNRTSDWDLNSEANGTVFWDMKSSEGLDIAAGYYMYHVKSHVTGKEKMGKFAVIK